MTKYSSKLNRSKGLWLSISLMVAALPLAAKEIELSGPTGGYINGDAWKITDHFGVVTTLFYIDPDQRSLNSELEARLEAEHFPIDLSNSVVIVSTEQSWLPNFAIEQAIKNKQKSHPSTIFVLDKSNALSDSGWLPSPGYVVVVLNQQGQRVYQKEGAFNTAEIDQLITLIWKTISQTTEIQTPSTTL